jgi:hypothetical protein
MNLVDVAPIVLVFGIFITLIGRLLFDSLIYSRTRMN